MGRILAIYDLFYMYTKAKQRLRRVIIIQIGVKLCDWRKI